MPLFCFRTSNAGRTSASDACEIESPDEVWKELTRLCGDLVAGNCCELNQNSEWSMEVLGATDTPLFRIRLVAETLVWPFFMSFISPLLAETSALILLKAGLRHSRQVSKVIAELPKEEAATLTLSPGPPRSGALFTGFRVAARRLKAGLHALHAPTLTEINTENPPGVRLTDVWQI